MPQEHKRATTLKPQRRFAQVLITATTLIWLAGCMNVSTSNTDLSGYLDGLIESSELVGISALVSHEGRIIYTYTGGELDIERNLPMSRDALMRVYSMTKPITSVAALMLVEQGHINLDAPLGRYLPEWQVFTVHTENGVQPANSPITVRHLLNHTSGLSYGYYGDTEVDASYRAQGLVDDWDYLVPDTATLSHKLSTEPLLFDPGSRFHYGFSTDVLGHVVERVTGMSLDKFVQRHIFQPLKMSSSYFDVPPTEFSRFGTNHARNALGDIVVHDGVTPRPVHGAGQNPEFIGVTFISGGGGLVTSIDDYHKFATALLYDDKLISPRTRKLMFHNSLLDSDPSPFGFGLGLAVVTSANSVSGLPTGTVFWGGAAGTTFWIDPKREFIGLFFTQQIDLPDEVHQRFNRLANELLRGD